MLKLSPYITIDTNTHRPYLTIAVIDSTEQYGEPKIGEVFSLNGVLAHTPVCSSSAAIARYCGYLAVLPALPPVAVVAARLQREFEQGENRIGTISA